MTSLRRAGYVCEDKYSTVLAEFQMSNTGLGVNLSQDSEARVCLLERFDS